jgi:glycerol-3-phosphate O-acyltransferase
MVSGSNVMMPNEAETGASHLGLSPEQPTVIGDQAFANEVTRRMLEHVLTRCERTECSIEEILYETIYQEQLRLEHPDRCSEADRKFVDGLRHQLARAGSSQRRELLRSVLLHYVHEITGHFDRRVYRLVMRMLPAALGALLHGGHPSPQLFDVETRVRLEGDSAGLQRAVRQGTVVLLPTHVSNLDPLLLGYAIFRLGLPPFTYGAALNLFSNAVTGFLMRHLGAFSVDRNNSDPLYRETLKEYSTVLLEHGQHMVFFPGGTRSRSGQLETRLKLGFLGTLLTAFGNRRARDPHSPPIFVVPCTLTYPLVLEGASLIDEYLIKEGGPHFVDVRDEFEHPERWFDFLRRLGELDIHVHVRFASPIDVLGNAVDEQGVSRDPAGRPLDPVRYLLVDGKVTRDPARDAEYTRLLAESVLGAQRKASVALPSSVLAFALFACLRRRFPNLDLFQLLRVLAPRAHVSLSELEPQIDSVLAALRAAAERGEIVLSPALYSDGRQNVLEQGVTALSAYHKVPVLMRHEHMIVVTEPTLLLYYRNRLEGFGLSRSPGPTGRTHRPSTWSAP